MAKNKQVANKPKKATRPRQRSRAGGERSRDLKALMSHIADPCNSDLSISGLPGQRGIISRFVQEEVVTLEIGEFWTFSYFPAITSYSTDITASSTVTFAPNLFSNGGPGTSFLGGNTPVAENYRPLGACIELLNETSNINRSGSWAVVHSPAQTIQGITTSARNLSASANERGTWGNGQSVMTNWRPGYLDDTYGKWNYNVDADLSDKNVITTVISAGDRAQTIRIRVTLVAEWTPRLGTTSNGITTTLVGSSTSNLKSSQVVAMLDKATPKWWNSALQMGKNIYSAVNAVASSPAFLQMIK